MGDKSPVVTIDRIEVEPIGRDKEMKPVLYFQGKDNALVLENKTNAKKDRGGDGEQGIHGRLVGCQIRIYATETEFAGESVECIRVKGSSPDPRSRSRRPRPLRTSEEDQIPF